VDLASGDERMDAISRGLAVPDDLDCWVVRADSGTPLAYAVVLAGDSERRVRAVAAADPADPAVAEAVVSAREFLIAGVNNCD